MKIEKFPLDKALNTEYLKYIGFKFALIYYYDEVLLKRITNETINIEKLIEARIFNDKEEIHIFEQYGFKAVRFLEEEETYIDEEYLLNENRFGKKLIIRNYIDYDEDNQAYIKYTRPLNILF